MPPPRKDKKGEEPAILTGAFVFPNGDRYEGEYVVTDGALERSGKGTHITASGIRMSGEWKADALNGEGLLEHPSGARYEGVFANNQFQGRGKYTWPDGSAYEGLFTENRLDGDGEFTDKNGQIWGGNFANKKAIGLQFKHQL